ncbi:His Kinase A (Phosphoacceptor) domain containing protein [Balamuthia mandrillaris]
MNQKLMHTILKSAGYAVELAEDGNEAVAMVKQHGAAHYSLILMDIMMPNCNGYEATMKIRQLASPSPSHPPSSSSSCSTPIDPAAATIPIVGVSATTASSVFEQCLASGMNDLIGKPYNVPALRAFLAQQLSPFSPSSASSSSSSSSSSL